MGPCPPARLSRCPSAGRLRLIRCGPAGPSACPVKAHGALLNCTYIRISIGIRPGSIQINRAPAVAETWFLASFLEDKGGRGTKR